MNEQDLLFLNLYSSYSATVPQILLQHGGIYGMYEVVKQEDIMKYH